MGTKDGQNDWDRQNLVPVWSNTWAGGVNNNTFFVIALQDLPTLQGHQGRSSQKATGYAALGSLDATEPEQETESQEMSPSFYSHSEAASGWNPKAKSQDGKPELDGKPKHLGQTESCLREILRRPDEEVGKWRDPSLW